MKTIQAANDVLTTDLVVNDTDQPLMKAIKEILGNTLRENLYELYLIEDGDWSFTKDQESNFILFRSDLRPPEEIFSRGFYPREKQSHPQYAKSEDETQVFMRKFLETGAIDIAPLAGISLTEQAKIAPYFPYYNQSEQTGVRYIYAVYVERYFKAHEFELNNGSPSTAAFKEIVCEQVPNVWIIGAFECEVTSRENTTTKYHVKKESLIWNEHAIDNVPDYEKRKLAMQMEFQKLEKYDYLKLTVEKERVRVQGRVPDKTSTNVVSVAESSAALFNKASQDNFTEQGPSSGLKLG